jgi:preprotein translocase subunit SecG
MNGLLVTIHVILSLILIGGILLQPGSKGGGLGATFGGGGANSAFGARGAAPILAKATYWIAGCFLATSILIEVLIVRNSRSVLEKVAAPAPAATTVPAPEAPAPQQAPAQK